METSKLSSSLLRPIVTAQAIKASFMARSSSSAIFGRGWFPDPSVAFHSLVVIRCLNDLRNMKGCPTLRVAFWILFLSHLWWHDGATCLWATCHTLIGWTWAHSSTRCLVFSHLGFWGKPLNAFLFLPFPSFLSSSFLHFLHFYASSFL